MSAINPYHPPTASVSDEPSAREAWASAGVGRRLRAYLTDSFIMWLLAIAMTILASVVIQRLDLFGYAAVRAQRGDFAAFALTGGLGLWFVVAVYHPLMEVSPWQATFGKRGLGMRATDAAGRRMSLLRALVRHALRMFPFVPLFVYPSGGALVLTLALVVASIVMAKVGRDKLALHDWLSHTRVQRKTTTVEARPGPAA